MKNQGMLRRFGFALAGLRATWGAEQSFRIHVIATAVHSLSDITICGVPYFSAFDIASVVVPAMMLGPTWRRIPDTSGARRVDSCPTAESLRIATPALAAATCAG